MPNKVEQPNDAGRLLTDKEALKRIEEKFHINRFVSSSLHRDVQRDLTASLKDAEHKQIVGEILRQIENRFPQDYVIQELKARYLKEDSNAKQ